MVGTDPDDELQPWPSAECEAPFDLLRELYEWDARTLSLDWARRLFADDLILTPSPGLVIGSYRAYFGPEGALDWFRTVNRHWPDLVTAPEQYATHGPHVVVLGQHVWPARALPAAWLWTIREGRVRALRSFRYPSEALARFAAVRDDDAARS